MSLPRFATFWNSGLDVVDGSPFGKKPFGRVRKKLIDMDLRLVVVFTAAAAVALASFVWYAKFYAPKPVPVVAAVRSPR